jgi:hypothetical protein
MMGERFASGIEAIALLANAAATAAALRIADGDDNSMTVASTETLSGTGISTAALARRHVLR